MLKPGVIAAAILALFGLGSLRAIAAEDARTVELVLPHPAAANQAVVLLVTAGVLPRGATIDVTTPNGELMGTVSPFAVHGGPAGTYTMAVIPSAIRDGRVTVRLSLRGGGQPTRAPTVDEVPKLSLEFIPTTE